MIIRERLVAHHALTWLVQLALRALSGTRSSGGPVDGPVRILVLNAFAMGGTTRAALNLAAHLSTHYDVELVSLARGTDEPFFEFPPRVRVTWLDDRRPGVRRGFMRRLCSKLPSALLHPDDGAYHWYRLWTDLVLLRSIRRMDSGVLVTTRASFSLFAARFSPPGVTLIAQEHRALDSYTDELVEDLRRHYPGLDALAVLTAHDQRGFQALLGDADVPVAHIPNSVAALPGEPGSPRDKVVLAAGRFNPVKGFDLLIEAFAPVARRHTDWQLRIRGEGGQRRALERLISEHGLDGRVQLAEPTPRLGEELATASIFVLSSRHEGFPMVVIEAMSKETAVVSFDCPIGPREAITNERDGVLVPPEDVDELSQALVELIEDEDRRRRLAAGAAETARRYAPEAIGARWERLLERVSAGSD